MPTRKDQRAALALSLSTYSPQYQDTERLEGLRAPAFPAFLSPCRRHREGVLAWWHERHAIV